MQRVWCFAILCIFAVAARFPEDYVNTLGGTQSRFDISSGNSLPLVARPFGFNSWAPMTEKNGGWWFHPDDRAFYGIRCTHQPSPWINDYGNFLISAGFVNPSHANTMSQFSSYNPLKSIFTPYHFKTEMLSFDSTSIEITSTERAAVIRVRFPKYIDSKSQVGFNQTRRLAFIMNSLYTDDVQIFANGTVIGSTQANNGGVPSRPNEEKQREYEERMAQNGGCLNSTVYDNTTNTDIFFRHYFHATVTGGENGTEPLEFESGVTREMGMFGYLDFDGKDSESQVITIRIATSLISLEQAALNLRREVGDRHFDDILEESRLAWREALSVVEIVDARGGRGEDELVVFYSSLWRSSLFPRLLFEYDANNQPHHYSPYDETGRTFPGVLSADSGFWDSYRTVYPQLSILRPKLMGTIVQGWVNGYKEGGWLTKWSSPGYRDSMVGTMGDCALADAIVKGISGFDVATAYEAIAKDAFEIPPTLPPGSIQHGSGRVALKSYLDYGFIEAHANGTAGPVKEVVSRTLNYAVADNCIANAARFLGHTEDAEKLFNRSIKAYQLLFDGEAGGFFKSKYPNGTWTEGFDEFAWGGDYTEASANQYRFYVPFDPQGLKQLYADHGLDMCELLERTQTVSSDFHVGAYATIIHEMTEMSVNCWGQYEHNNQPSHHVLYMFIAQGDSVDEKCAARGQYYLRKAMRDLYLPHNAMFSGDEDNGEMSSWYLLSAMGLYQLDPASPHFTFGSPLFSHLKINLENGRELNIKANNAEDAFFVQSVFWNDELVSGTTIPYATLMEGGTLFFNMTSRVPY